MKQVVNSVEKWLTIALLCLSGSILFWLPFLSEFYYVPMQQAFGFSKTQMGALSSVFGFCALIGYIPGGWLADRFEPRDLLAIALALTGMTGFIYSTLPSFEISLLLYATWGLSSAFIFWAALIKATRNWAPREEQGRAFGLLEGGRGIVDLATATILLGIFALLGSDGMALSRVIQLISISLLALAILVWFNIKKDTDLGNESRVGKSTLSLADSIAVLKLPVVWLIAIIIMGVYSGLWGTIFFTPYATEVYALGAVLGGAIAVGKLWVKPFAAIVAGIVADRVGASKTVVGGLTIMMIGFAVFAAVPGNSNMIPFLVINVAIISTMVFALRGIYFALLEQGGIPIAVTGAATGIASVIGFTPEVFLPVVGGMLLDASPGPRGYQNFFLVIAGLNFIGLVAAFLLYRKTSATRRDLQSP